MCAQNILKQPIYLKQFSESIGINYVYDSYNCVQDVLLWQMLYKVHE